MKPYTMIKLGMELEEAHNKLRAAIDIAVFKKGKGVVKMKACHLWNVMQHILKEIELNVKQGGSTDVPVQERLEQRME